MYIFGYCSWGFYIVRETGHRQCWILYAKQATDSGPGLHSNPRCRRTATGRVVASCGDRGD